MWKYDFFIVHAGPDKELAELLYTLLSTEFKVFLDARSLIPGDNWSQVIPLAHSQSAVSLILITGKTPSAHYMNEEIIRAVKMARKEGSTHRVVPIVVGDQLDSPYGLDMMQAIYVTDPGGLSEAVRRLQADLRPSLAMPSEEIQRRYQDRVLLEKALRLIPRRDFAREGSLGREVRKYVFVGDYEEQRHRTLQEILSNLMVGDAFERIADSYTEWIALTFSVGELNARKLDLKPGTWKSAFRILSHPHKIGCIEATSADRAQMGTRPYDYYSGDQEYWHSRLMMKPREYLTDLLGIYWGCFNGDGITEAYQRGSVSPVPSRIFFVKNVPVATLTYSHQDMGAPSEGRRLN